MLFFFTFVSSLLKKKKKKKNTRSTKDKKDHRTPLVQWLLYKYKCLWGVGGKGRDSNF